MSDDAISVLGYSEFSRFFKLIKGEAIVQDSYEFAVLRQEPLLYDKEAQVLLETTVLDPYPVSRVQKRNCGYVRYASGDRKGVVGSSLLCQPWRSQLLLSSLLKRWGIKNMLGGVNVLFWYHVEAAAVTLSHVHGGETHSSAQQ